MQMKDIEAQLELARTDTVADKLKDAEQELRVLRIQLADLRCVDVCVCVCVHVWSGRHDGVDLRFRV
jgi:hypothetical protein